MADYALVVSGGIQGAATSAGSWAVNNQSIMVIVGGVLLMFVLYQIFLKR